MKIKHKIMGLTGLSILALIVIVAITEISNLRLIKLEKTLIEVKSLDLSMVSLNRIELEFIDEKSLSKKDYFAAEYKQFSTLIEAPRGDHSELGIEIRELP
ncbi:hypothetical protein [Shewanella gelidii]|uniref:Uncharacterized protein n=1 Tax=Shewanella gelidii TaxID=1642821 RepID=A0A917N905_9GAMM|nr:hypothetical protein [Shewanella gelidii]MCL1097124.1 hypothetical protein [Shewanella gelidii]GGI72708.1 hypothetical protein GCM10009332_07700 [Shewanella gelidii]